MSKPAWDQTVADLFDAHARALLLYARQWAGPPDAEDLVQRVFVRLLGGKKPPAEPRPWLFRCVRNEAMAVWRAEKRRSLRESVAAADADRWFVARSDDPLNAAEAQVALESLPAELREVVALRLWSGLTLSEISNVTDVAVSTVHARYAAAIESLRSKLEPSCKTLKT